MLIIYPSILARCDDIYQYVFKLLSKPSEEQIERGKILHEFAYEYLKSKYEKIEFEKSFETVFYDKLIKGRIDALTDKYLIEVKSFVEGSQRYQREIASRQLSLYQYFFDELKALEPKIILVDENENIIEAKPLNVDKWLNKIIYQLKNFKPLTVYIIEKAYKQESS